jgi:nucleotide sugar dehydrogenase
MPEGGDVFIIAVGTPVDHHADVPRPRLEALEAAVDMVADQLRPGALVVLRSTVPIGTVRGLVATRLEARTGLVAGRDFHLAFAPERTAEGSALSELRELPQLVAGINDDSVEATVALFRELTPTIVRMESLEAAELAKLVNNSFRDLIFAFANEVTQLAAPYGFDVVEAIRSANRAYPRDPVPLPSPGVGGPCLTKDPYILAAGGPGSGLADTLMAHGRRVNESMPGLVAERVVKQLAELGKDPASCTVLVCGMAFKGHPETGDVRDSTSLEIVELLRGEVGTIRAHDPVVTAAELAALDVEPVTLPEGFAGADAVLFLTNHLAYRRVDVFAMVRDMRAPAVVLDAWHVFVADDVLRAGPSVYLGLGHRRSSA